MAGLDAAARRDPRAHGRTRLGWRTGLYRVGVDAAVFLGPLVCGLLGEAHTPIFIALVGVAAFAIAVRLGRGGLGLTA